MNTILKKDNHKVTSKFSRAQISALVDLSLDWNSRSNSAQRRNQLSYEESSPRFADLPDERKKEIAMQKRFTVVPEMTGKNYFPPELVDRKLTLMQSQSQVPELRSYHDILHNKRDLLEKSIEESLDNSSATPIDIVGKDYDEKERPVPLIEQDNIDKSAVNSNSEPNDNELIDADMQIVMQDLKNLRELKN